MSLGIVIIIGAALLFFALIAAACIVSLIRDGDGGLE